MSEAGGVQGFESDEAGREIEALQQKRRDLEAVIGVLEAEVQRLRQQRNRRELRALSLTLFVFGFAAWLFLVGTSWVEPNSVTGQLTHFAPWPRTDEFGEVGFVVSFFSFLAWNYLREHGPPPPL